MLWQQRLRNLIWTAHISLIWDLFIEVNISTYMSPLGVLRD